MGPVTVKRERLVIPTYEAAAYDKNPMFLEKRVYQGSSGRVYPHPVCEGVSDKKTDHTYDAVWLENDYLRVLLLPELGGRVQRLYDKTNGYDAVYYNEVIKPALVGLAGPWISGGIEFNWPQHHRPSTFDPVDCVIEKGPDGSVTIWMGETEKMFHTKGMAGFTLYPDRAYLEIKGRLYNPTDRPQTFLWWANPAVAVNDHTQSVFPPDVHAVMDHGKRDVSKFPIADGVYYKYDYAPGTDISRYKNIPVPTSYMAYHSDLDFIGNYDHEKRAGLLHIADHHVSPGKKQWTWGNGDFGRAWDRNLTDANGPYIELMTGVFTDNQPDFTFLKPYEEKTFTQYFMPYKAVGAVKNASLAAAINVEMPTAGKVRAAVYTPSGLEGAVLTVYAGGRTIFSAPLDLPTAGVFERVIDAPGMEASALSAAITRDGRTILEQRPAGEPEDLPAPAEAIPAPEELPTTEKLYLAAVHLEQYRHATRSPEPYYLEGLRRDPSDIRLNDGYGRYLYGKGLFAESVPYFRAAIKAATWKNPNPYDCEPYYDLGLALKRTGGLSGAYDAFYKAAWDGSLQQRAFYELACLAAAKGDFPAALDFVEQSLVRGLHNLKARTLKTALLRLTGAADEAWALAAETQKLDPLDHGCRYELYRLTGEGLDAFRALLRDDEHSYIELALTYLAAGLAGEADRVLALSPGTGGPLVHYYRFYCTGDEAELQKAESASSLYCFPNRLEDIPVLEKAVQAGGSMAAYYLGELFYDRGRWQEAVELWEGCAARIKLPTVWRNLALAYYNKQGDGPKARQAIETAFAMDPTDARVFFELDQLCKALNEPVEKRLENMRAHRELLAGRDDLYTEYVTLLNLTGAYDEAYDRIMDHVFHPWEGGEGKVPAQYRAALMGKAGSNPDRAVEYLEAALVYPANLGEGKLIGSLDNDVNYLLGRAYSDREKSERAYVLAARGPFQLTSATYYNDQPPEMMYYAAKALEALGDTAEAARRFDRFIAYAHEHMDDHVTVDYFAVSLPDFLIFNGDLDRKNRVHCLYMAALGWLGLGGVAQAKRYAAQGLALEDCHAGLRRIAAL